MVPLVRISSRLCTLLRRGGRFAVFAGVLAMLAGCVPRAVEPGPTTSRAASSPQFDGEGPYLRGEGLGAEVEGRPWVAHVTTADLDRDGQPEVLACEAQAGVLLWLRRDTGSGAWSEQALAEQLPAPVHVESADMDRDGDVDLLVACMGQVFPSNERIGSLVLLRNDGRQRFSPQVLLERVARVTDARAADFDRDGRTDIVVGQFGYLQGEVRVLWQRADGTFSSEIMLDLPGTVNVPVADFDGDGAPDFAVLVSQQYEEIVLFTNRGEGRFARRTIFGSTNEDFGSSGLVAADLNRDGRPDLLYTNGDGFDYAEPGGRPWHGVQWLENTGTDGFVLHRIGELSGAYAPVAADLDGDGDLDVAAVSGFNDWRDPQAVSLAIYRNDGAMRFTALAGAHAPTHLLTAVAADFEDTGRPQLVTGGFHAYPPWDRMSRLVLWRTRQP